MPYSSYESNNHQFEYNTVPYYSCYDSHSYSSIAYSTSTYGGLYNPGPTQFAISYSTVEFDVPEFEDYDPTPYGGGYDLAQTYGKPLPPSDEICYPRSTPDPNSVSLDGVALGSGQKEDDGSKKSLPYEEEQQVNDSKEEPHHYDDDYSWSGHGIGYGNGAAEEPGYQPEKPVPPPPSGYGLEAMDICESLFGYWPCWSREKRRWSDGQGPADEGSNSDPWKGSADYIFGSSCPYGERRDSGGSYGDPNYCYARHYQEQPLYRQVDYDEDSW